MGTGPDPQELQVDPKELQSAVRALDEVMKQIGGIHLSEELGNAGSAMPGGDSPEAITKVGKAWDRQISGWLNGPAKKYNSNLTAQKSTYDKSESASAQSARNAYNH